MVKYAISFSRQYQQSNLHEKSTLHPSGVCQNPGHPRHPSTSCQGIWTPKTYRSNTVHLRRYLPGCLGSELEPRVSPPFHHHNDQPPTLGEDHEFVDWSPSVWMHHKVMSWKWPITPMMWRWPTPSTVVVSTLSVWNKYQVDCRWDWNLAVQNFRGPFPASQTENVDAILTFQPG